MERLLFDIKRKKNTVIMKKVDCERDRASFLSFILPPVLCERRLQVLWGNWLHNQTFPNFEHFGGGGGGTVLGRRRRRRRGCRVAAETVGAEIFLYLDC